LANNPVSWLLICDGQLIFVVHYPQPIILRASGTLCIAVCGERRPAELAHGLEALPAGGRNDGAAPGAALHGLGRSAGRFSKWCGMAKMVRTGRKSLKKIGKFTTI
jgi:hypothetical protein